MNQNRHVYFRMESLLEPASQRGGTGPRLEELLPTVIPGGLQARFRVFQVRSVWACLRAAPLPAVFTVISLALAWLCIQNGLECLLNDSHASGVFVIGAGLFCLCVCLCSLADARCRVREYLRIRHLLQAYGFRPRLYQRISRSRCQRDAILQAGREAGNHQEIKTYFASLGYRWYHILPDMLALSPVNLISPHFLRSTFWPCKTLPARLRKAP